MQRHIYLDYMYRSLYFYYKSQHILNQQNMIANMQEKIEEFN